MFHRFMRYLFLAPIARMHGWALKARHALYDRGLRRAEKGAISTVVLGNLTVGGTGKTPLTELVVRELEALVGEGNVGVLSRGYGRKSSGFGWVNSASEALQVGDEPCMLFRKLPHAPIAVCESRLEGLERMRADFPNLQWVVCDDAFQHRQLIPTFSILIIDSTQPVHLDALLPLGRLRDVPERMHAADAVIVTRLDDLYGDLRTAYARSLSQEKPVFGSRMETAPLRRWPDNSLCPNGDPSASPDQRERVMAVAGIARPERFMDRLAERFQVVRREAFADHRAFTERDAKRWRRIMEADRLHALVMTEKDAVRLPQSGVPGMEIRYEPLLAAWTEPQEFRSWLRQQIQSNASTPSEKQ